MVVDEALHPDSRLEAMRARLPELDQPIYGTKEILWTRLSKAEKVNKAHQEKLKELRERYERAIEERPTVPLESFLSQGTRRRRSEQHTR